MAKKDKIKEKQQEIFDAYMNNEAPEEQEKKEYEKLKNAKIGEKVDDNTFKVAEVLIAYKEVDKKHHEVKFKWNNDGVITPYHLADDLQKLVNFLRGLGGREDNNSEA